MSSIKVALLILLAASSVSAEEPARRNLAVYLPDYRVKEGTRLKLYGTTHLILFSAKPNDDGSVDFSRITPELLACGKEAQTDGNVKVSVCVGGWGRGKLFANAVSTSETRGRFVASLVSFCETHQLDGVDIDWEYPKGEQEHADFAVFLEALSGRLRSTNRILTVALAETRPLPAECWPFIDRVNLMSYQPWNPQPYETWLTEAVEGFLKTGLPPEKLLLGVGFYAKEQGGERRAVSWKKLAGENASAIPESEHPFSPVGPETCDLRIRLAEKHGLGGIMVWDYGHDSAESEDSLLRHLSAKLGRTPQD